MIRTLQAWSVGCPSEVSPIFWAEPTAALQGGDKWALALRMSTGACRVVVCFVTARGSHQTNVSRNFGRAWYMGESIHIRCSPLNTLTHRCVAACQPSQLTIRAIDKPLAGVL